MTTSIQASSPALEHGFKDPVQDSQLVFRQLLKAMSEPGTLMKNEFFQETSGLTELGFYRSSYGVALSLLDSETNIGLSPKLDHALIRNSLSFHTSCPISNLDQSSSQPLDFLFLEAEEWGGLSNLESLSVGDLSYPEKSTTLIVQLTEIVDEQSDGSKQDYVELSLSGPGIERQRSIYVKGITDEVFASLRKNQDLFPLGYDFVITSPDGFSALPRTCQIKARVTGDSYDINQQERG